MKRPQKVMLAALPLAVLVYLVASHLDGVLWAAWSLQRKMTLSHLQGKYPNLRYYLALRDELGVSLRPSSFAPGRHSFWGHEYFMDSLGAKYASEATFRRLEGRPFRKHFAVLGSSVAFGISPLESASFVDYLNDLQSDIRFHNFARPGASCKDYAETIDRQLASQKFDGVVAYEGINLLPYSCSDQQLAKTRSYHTVRAHRRRVEENVRKLHQYDGLPFVQCHEQLIERLARDHLPLVVIKFALPFDERMHDRELYDTMVNGQCSAAFELQLIRIHNRALDSLPRRTGYDRLFVFDSAGELFGDPSYFWDACHLGPKGNEKLASALLRDLAAHGLAEGATATTPPAGGPR